MPKRDWLREKEVLVWQPWLTSYRLRQWISAGDLRLKIGGTPTRRNCDVWQRTATGSVRFFRKLKIKQICCGASSE